MKKKKKFVDISILLPCSSVLLLHSKRADYVACVWKRSLQANVELSNISDNGWEENPNICWIEEPFPKDIEKA